MQQGAGSQYGVSPEMSPFGSATGTRTQIAGSSSTHQQQGVAEEASPISSRPPAHSSTGNFDELLPVAGGLPDDDALAAGDEPDRGGISGGNRWPRQETLALLKIRSDMDVVFRDASLKGPLWEEVSRKLAELGYRRSAKKCKEKFENVHKYYKRTKEGRAGRQDGKSYRFFSQLEALHTTPTTPNIISPVQAAMISTPAVVVTTATNTNTNTTAIHIAPTNLNMVTPVSMGIGGISSVRIPPSTQATPSVVPSSFGASPMFPPGMNVGASGSAPITGNPVGISFSSNSSSSFSSGSEEEEEDDLDGDPSNTDSSRGLKRKRGYSSSKGGGESSSKRMMEFFEGLMKQVMQKQETMQQRFLEIIEKREQDRMIREEAWRRQEMARLSREQEVMAQERAISASRDAAIIAFLQKITGQTIQLPSSAAVTISAAPPPPPTPGPPPPSSHPAPHLQIPQQQQQQHQQQQQPQQQHQQHLHQHQVQSQITEVTRHQSQSQPQVTCTDIVMAEVVRHQTQPPVSSSDIIVAVPEQQLLPEVGGSSGGGSFDPTSSRWPKVEVLALIKLRSGLEGKYQEAGPKGPLWEEISAGMQRMGYKRSAKRCKEKWENINKYFKKVKESNKKRPQDAKTCPYFHELDALYRRKILGCGGGSGSGSSSQTRPEQQQQQQQQQPPQQPPPQPQQQQERMVLDPIQTQALPAPQLAQQGVESEKRIVDTNIDLQARNGGFPANLFGEGSNTGAGASAKKPEDIVKELMGQQQLQQQRRELMMDEYEKMDEQDSDNLDEDEYDDDDEDSGDDNGKLRYKIEFQRQNAAGGSSNGSGGNGTPSFAAMVQ